VKKIQITNKIISLVITIIIFFSLSVLLFNANIKINVVAIINQENKFLKEDQTILSADEKYNELKLPTMSLKSNEIFTLNAIVNPEYKSLKFSNVIRKRAQWCVLYRSNNSKWISIKQKNIKHFQLSVSPKSNPGHYLILYAIPATSLSLNKLNNKSTSYICEFLSKNTQATIP
jgi:hypothetical protein